jgi:hypothetical protein
MISTDKGIEIDGSDEQYQNADSSIRESLDSLSKLTFNKALQSKKHLSQRISTDEGIQIDRSDEQRSNADSPIRESLHSLSNRTIETVVHPAKQPQHNSVIEFGIITSETFPKYSKIQLPSKFSNKPPETLKFKLSSAIEISSKGVPQKAKLPK